MIDDDQPRFEHLERMAGTLQHMLGTDSDTPGYRNHFCAEVDGEDWCLLREMHREGLVVPGRRINDMKDQYFHATAKGCRVAGLNRESIERQPRLFS